MKALVVIVVLVCAALFGFRVFAVPEEKELALRTCELASKFNGFPDGWETWGPDSRAYRAFNEACMAAAGYRQNNTAHRCEVNFFTEHSPWCYSPISTIDAAAWRVYLTTHGGAIGGLLSPVVSYGNFGGAYFTVLGFNIVAPPGWNGLITSSPPEPLNH